MWNIVVNMSQWWVILKDNDQYLAQLHIHIEQFLSKVQSTRYSHTGSSEDMPGGVYCYISFLEQVGGGDEK